MLTVSWNLQDGGIDEGNASRLGRQLRLLADIGADVVLIQEAKHWLERGGRGVHMAEWMLGARVYLATAPRHGCHLAVLVRNGSNIEVLRSRHERHAPFWHAQARIFCKVADRKMIFASAHFSPFSPDLRVQEAQASSDLAGAVTVLGGDFNDPALGETTHWSGLPGYKAVRHAAVDDPARQDERPARVLDQAGFIDVAAFLSDTRDQPELRTPTSGFSPTSVPIRCDRIYVSKPLRKTIRRYEVIEQEESDHHIVLAELDLKHLT
ncbi:endonuclease/exonuclease/phosphatase family protein [Sphaerisporangium sp. NPDC004334]